MNYYQQALIDNANLQAAVLRARGKRRRDSAEIARLRKDLEASYHYEFRLHCCYATVQRFSAHVAAAIEREIGPDLCDRFEKMLAPDLELEPEKEVER